VCVCVQEHTAAVDEEQMIVRQKQRHVCEEKPHGKHTCNTDLKKETLSAQLTFIYTAQSVCHSSFTQITGQ